MIIERLKIQNFRNIENCEIYPSKGMNVICGENAQGKTNILEAIWLFGGAKSFRGAKEKELVKLGCEACKNQVFFEGEGIKKDITLQIKEKRVAFLNGKNLKNSAELAKSFNVIVFSPADLRLVTDGPAARRRFLDLAIGQIYPSYIENLRDYLRAVTQRNSCLKDLRYDSTVSVLLDVFEEEIEEKGKFITEKRKEYLKDLEEFILPLYSEISGKKESVSINYISSFKENIKEQLKENRKEEMFSLVTSIGPHRDDIEFKINGMNVRNFASQGQKRSVALAVKLSQAGVIEKNVGECPVCLMDDVLSELDPARQNFVLNHISEMQTFLTCCDPQNYKNLKAGKIFSVKKGKIE